MATYVIGDVQGCVHSLEALIARIAFDSARDDIWLVGDLVNRGPRSLDVLRWAYARRDRVTIVLGNHDLHLIARAIGVSKDKRRDTLDAILDAGDAAELIYWLRQQALLVERDGWLLIHAGLLPKWTIGEARQRARAAEAILRGGPRKLARLLRREADAKLAEERETIAVLTRLRMIDERGRPSWKYKGPPRDAPSGELPWFEAPKPAWAGVDIVCGHWAALGLHIAPPIHALDTGCVWGGSLTALRLDDRATFQQAYVD